MLISTMASIKPPWYCSKCGGLNYGEQRVCDECEGAEEKP
jgi:hypothetical protein